MMVSFLQEMISREKFIVFESYCLIIKYRKPFKALLFLEVAHLFFLPHKNHQASATIRLKGAQL